MTKDSIILYKSQFKIVKESLSAEEIGNVFIALFDFADGNEVETDSLNSAEKMAFQFLKNQLGYDMEKYEKRCKINRENGRKGGRPKTEQNRTKPNESKQNPNDNDNENENDNENVNDNDNSSSFRRRPSKEEVEEFIEEENLNVNPEEFYQHYSDLDWIINGMPINSWKMLCRKWAEKNKAAERPKPKEFEPEPKIDAVPMPEDIRKKLKLI